MKTRPGSTYVFVSEYKNKLITLQQQTSFTQTSVKFFLSQGVKLNTNFWAQKWGVFFRVLIKSSESNGQWNACDIVRSTLTNWRQTACRYQFHRNARWRSWMSWGKNYEDFLLIQNSKETAKRRTSILALRENGKNDDPAGSWRTNRLDWQQDGNLYVFKFWRRKNGNWMKH